MRTPPSAVRFLAAQVERARRIKPQKRIVFPEGTDPRVIQAAARVASEGLAEPILVGPAPAGAPAGVRFIEPDKCSRIQNYARLFWERRRSRGVTEAEAAAVARKPFYYACLMVAAGDADGFVGGAATSTAETMRPALQVIGTPPKIKTVSGVMIVCTHHPECGAGGVLAMADPALVIDPTPSQLADIAIATAGTVRALLDVEPVVALLSFSTKGSARHPFVQRVLEARRIVAARQPDLHIDGELQADAALVDAVGRFKAPGSTVAGHANALIFPGLASANIGVKLVERLGDAVSIGPFIQGLAKPANDLTRGASPEDIYNVAVITILQAEQTQSVVD